jgi:hypothetical protein
VAESPAPRVFLSHSHRDKRLARRIVRRLTAHRIAVWVDERELRLGAALTASIQAQIAAADVLLVVATEAAAASTWVGLEIACARQHGKTIIPVFFEAVDRAECFRDCLGVYAVAPQTVGIGVHDLARDLWRAVDAELLPPDGGVLVAGLRDLAREEPALAPLILGCLDGEGLHAENVDGASAAPFHALDEALDALYDAAPSRSTAFHAAYGFARAGAGTRALSLWIAATGDGEMPLVTAVGHRPLDPAWIDTAIRLLAACGPPNNQALAGFIHHNADRFSPPQRETARRLVTWPVRGPERMGADLGMTALIHLSESDEISAMWSRWIRGGAFDGQPCAPVELARYLVEAQREQVAGRERLDEALRTHVRTALRSGDVSRISTALTHIDVCARAGAPIASAMVREAHGCVGSAEWVTWAARDPETAARLRTEVEQVADETMRRIGSGTCGAG